MCTIAKLLVRKCYSGPTRKNGDLNKNVSFRHSALLLLMPSFTFSCVSNISKMMVALENKDNSIPGTLSCRNEEL